MPSPLSKFWFKFIHSSFLVYNICWEDSEIDRQLLQINSKSDLLTITSAGCNVLNYLIDTPNSIHCIDINPKQTALLELKIALIKNGDYDLFFGFFGNGKSVLFLEIYGQIRNFISAPSRRFWDSRIDYFNPQGKGLFYNGGAGWFARFLNRTLKKKRLNKTIKDVIFEKDKDRRSELFKDIIEKLWSGFESKIWKSPMILSLAGVPKSQREAIGDINEFMKNSLRNIFVKQSANTNYFWRVYLEGSFTEDCCPDYLKKENFELLKKNIDRLHISTGVISDFLRETDSQFTHIVLLDYMDWLAGNDEAELIDNWEKILSATLTGSKILFRTAYPNADFIPEFVKSKMSLQQIDPNWVAKNDKVGTYSGTYLGVV